MTVREVYQFGLMERRKAKAPSFHLEEFNYLLYKGIQEYCNTRYAQFAINQQLSDDLQSLVRTANISFTYPVDESGLITGAYTGGFTDPTVGVSTGSRYGSNFLKFKAPDNYWHMLGSHVTAATTADYKCYPAGTTNQETSKRLTQNVANGIINNDFLKPAFNRPYHSFVDALAGGVKPDLMYFVGPSSRFRLTEVAIDFLKDPERVALTETQRDLPLDTSETMEFPDYVCNEIIKRMVTLELEVASDPRLQSFMGVNASIK
tara:strand:- start:1607 stop:2392 length:786 start_codon:yes stop_codon:yes gene_type:complete